jgi:hypothetical protein
MKETKTPGELQEHMLWTYYGLRVGLAVIGITLPIAVLVAGGVLHSVWWEPSISAYYHTKPKLLWFTTRDIFVGGLLAAAACLYLYKGYSNKENVVLNLAGIFALLVALLPTAAPGQPSDLVSKLHGTSAVSFFLCIAYVSLVRSRDTLSLVATEKRRKYERLYMATGLAMIASPAAAVALSFLLEPHSQVSRIVFLVETFAIWSFSAYWIVKTREMRESSAERRTLSAELRRDTISVSAQDTPDGVRVPAAKPRAVERIVPTSPTEIT